MAQQLALQAYRVLGIKDYGRIDMKLTQEGPVPVGGEHLCRTDVYASRKPHSYIGFMARAEGKNGKDLLDEIIRAAIKRLNLTPGNGEYMRHKRLARTDTRVA